MIQGHRRSHTSCTRRLNKPIGWASFASCTGICVTPAWQQAHLSIGYNAQCKSPTIIRRQHPEYLAINAQLAQIMLRLLHQVFEHFFLLAKRGATPAQLPSVCCRASRDQAPLRCACSSLDSSTRVGKRAFGRNAKKLIPEPPSGLEGVVHMSLLRPER
jgi:hypothetical protein